MVMKIKKSVLSFCTSSLFIFQINAQNPNQIGINATIFAKQFVVLNNFQIQEANPYLFTYRRIGKKLNFRTAIGGKYKYDNNDNASSRSYSETNIKSLWYRIGLDKTVQLAPKWNFYFGADLITFQSREKVYSRYTTSGGYTTFTTSDRKEWLYGLSPNLGFEWKVNARISIYTETYIQFYRRKYSEKLINYSPSNPPGPGINNIINTGNASITTPTSIFVNFRF